MFEVSVRSHFSSAHHLRGYHGKCEAAHGHNWEVEVFVRGEELDKDGLLMDFRHLKRVLKLVMDGIDHTDLNSHKSFKKTNPTSENIARFLYKELAARLKSRKCRLYRVCVHETPETGSSYWEE
jgi:6-pyruvoyltetrahydropterin/6-carboxytetrahydropterin synthase